MLRAMLSVRPGQPLVISDVEQLDADLELTEHERVRNRQVGQTLKAYRLAGRSLLAEKYPDLRDIAPPQFRTECDCLAIFCDDGIIVRYDQHGGDNPKVRVGTMLQGGRGVTAAAPMLSEGYVHCPLDPSHFQLPPGGPTFQLFRTNHATGERTMFVDAQQAVVIPWGEIRQNSQQASRPVPLVSLGNEIELLLRGEMYAEHDPLRPGAGQEFFLRSRMRLNVGWETFEIYPPFDETLWQPSAAPSWAELDLLAVAVRHNLSDQQFQAIDPHAAARKQYVALFREFQSLLEGLEAPLQQFLQAHPNLLRACVKSCGKA